MQVFTKAVDAVRRATANAEPSDAPSQSLKYPGSRWVKNRYRYEPSAKCAFIELHPDHVLTPEDWKPLLEAVPGVQKVVLHPKGSKQDQGNVGDHYQTWIFYVYSHLYPKHGMEFELTRHDHMKLLPDRSFTVTAMFKEQPDHVHLLEAWRILRHSLHGKELLPSVVEQYEKELRAKANQGVELDSVTDS